MKVYTVINSKGKVESHYAICHNLENKFQLVALPWNRIDHRVFETEDEALKLLKETVWNHRRSVVTESTLIAFPK